MWGAAAGMESGRRVWVLQGHAPQDCAKRAGSIDNVCAKRALAFNCFASCQWREVVLFGIVGLRKYAS